MKRMARIAAAATGAVATAVVTAVLLSGSAGPSGAAAPRQPSDTPITAHATDRLPSRTAQDWVTYADHVVVVTAVSERRLQPNANELARGEGLVGRHVTLRVDEVLWSRTGAPQPAPRTWQYSAAGWHFADGDTGRLRKMVLEDRPRVESGHSYVMAIAWEAPRCAEGDGRVPGQWLGLGEGSEIPYDAGVLGNGEEEGRTLRAADAADAGDDPGAGLEERLAGRTADALTAELEAARPTARGEFGAQPEAKAGSCG